LTVAGKKSGGGDAKLLMLDVPAPVSASPPVPWTLPRATPPAAVSGPGEGRAWTAALRGPSAVREPALAELHALLVRAARYELRRRRAQLADVGSGELEDLAVQAADDALVAILSKLDSFRGSSRFTTWAYKFALLEAGVKARRRAWQGREIAIDEERWPEFPAAGRSPQQCLEDTELLAALQAAVESSLTAHQREVFAALALNAVPIDVLAERLNTTRGALYKTLHDARRKLRDALAAAGYAREVHHDA
jgi:RNA polymerase sigma-70 factor (ECF subfamily)